MTFKWIAVEEDSDKAIALLGRSDLCAPSLMLLEVGNALWKQARRRQIDPAVSFSDDLDAVARFINIVNESPFVGRALEIARLLDHAIYDCVYLAMAEIRQDILVSADLKFLGKARQHGFEHLVETLA